MNREKKFAQMIKFGVLILLAVCRPSFSQIQEGLPNTSTYDSTINALDTSVDQNRVQINKLGEEINKLKAAITSLMNSAEANNKDLLEEITDIRRETEGRIENITSIHTVVKQELDALTSLHNRLMWLNQLRNL